MYSGLLRSSNSIIARIEVSELAALDRCAAAQPLNGIRAWTIRILSLRRAVGRRSSESRECSGLAVSKLRAGERSRAENASRQFQRNSSQLADRYRTPCSVRSFEEIGPGGDVQLLAT